MNTATWIVLAVAAVIAYGFWRLLRNSKALEGNDPRYDVIDVREPSNVSVLDDYDEARAAEIERRGSAS